MWCGDERGESVTPTAAPIFGNCKDVVVVFAALVDTAARAAQLATGVASAPSTAVCSLSFGVLV